MELLFAAFAVALAQLVKGVTGFGSALIAVPLLAWLWGPAEAIFVATALDLIAALPLVYDVRRDIRVRHVLAVFALLPLGQWIGTDLLAILDERLVLWGIALVVGAFAIGLLARPVREGRGEHDDVPEGQPAIWVVGALAGLAGGLMAGLVGAPGPPLVAYMRHWFTDRFFRAQLIALFALNGVTLLPMLFFKGAATTQQLSDVAYLIVPLLAGVGLGIALAGRLPRVWFGRLVGLLLLGTAGALVLL